MEFEGFEHAAWLARAWQDGPPRHDLGASALRAPPFADRVDASWHESDVSGLDLHAGTPLRDALAARWGLDPERLLVTAGTTGANAAALLAFVQPGCNVVCERPYYAPLPHLARGLGAAVRFVDRDEDGRLDPQAVAEALDDNTALVLLTSPNNPTGAVASAADLRALGDAASAVRARVLVDQVYRELSDFPVAAQAHDACLTTAGFNKCWGAPGLRTGWLAGAADDVERVRGVHLLSAMAPPPLGTRVGLALLADEARARAALEDRLAATHPVYEAWCGETGRTPGPAWLTGFPEVGNDRAVSEAALDAGLLVIPGTGFGAPGHVRVGLGIPPEELAAGLEALASVASSLDAQTL